MQDLGKTLAGISAEEFASATYVAKENGKLVGMACCPIINGTICDIPVSVGQLGMVATHIYSRGKGYMKELMRLMLEDAKDIDIVVLGGKHQRYQPHGFDHAGTQYIVNYSQYSLRKSFGDTNICDFRFVEIESGSEISHKAWEIYKIKMPAIFRTEDNSDTPVFFDDNFKPKNCGKSAIFRQ